MYPSTRIIPHHRCVTWLIRLRDMTHSNVWHDSLGSNDPSSTHPSSLFVYLFILHVRLSNTRMRTAMDVKSIYLSIYPSCLFIYQFIHHFHVSNTYKRMALEFKSVDLSIDAWGLFIYQVYRCIKCIGLPPNSLYAYRLRPPSLNSWNSRKGLLVLTPHTTFYFDSRQNIWFWLYTRHLCGL